jgi:hypothetical protein
MRPYELGMCTNTLFMLGYLDPRRRGGLICAHCSAHGQRNANQSMHVLPCPSDLHSGDQGEPTKLRGLGGSSRSLDDDEEDLIYPEEVEADGKRHQRSLSHNVWRVMLGIAVQTSRHTSLPAGGPTRQLGAACGGPCGLSVCRHTWACWRGQRERDRCGAAVAERSALPYFVALALGYGPLLVPPPEAITAHCRSGVREQRA